MRTLNHAVNVEDACHSIPLKMALTKGPVYAGLGWENDNLRELEARQNKAIRFGCIELKKGFSFPADDHWDLKKEHFGRRQREKPWGPDTRRSECSLLSTYECVKSWEDRNLTPLLQKPYQQQKMFRVTLFLVLTCLFRAKNSIQIANQSITSRALETINHYGSVSRTGLRLIQD